MENLPDEALQQIFSLLSARDLLHATWTCCAWRQILTSNPDWWHAWCLRRSLARPAPHVGESLGEDSSAAENWQQRALTRGLHIPWRFKPVTAKRLLYCVGRQDGWDRRGRPPAVLVEGDWALLTCTPGREGPTGGRDRLQLVKFQTQAPNAPQGRSRTLRHLEQHWLDFGTNKYKPYALQGGATDLHMPFVAQGRASDVVVWKANQQYPIAWLHQQDGITVPAVALERSPWGQSEHAEALRLVSCSDTGKVSAWQVSSVESVAQPELLWQGLAADLCNKPNEACQVGALAMWTLSRPTGDSRNSCCIAVGTNHFGVALLSLSFNQHGSKGIKSQGVRLLSHTAPVLRMCIAWDHTPAVCPFPSSSSPSGSFARHQAAASSSVGGDEEEQAGRGEAADSPAEEPESSTASNAHTQQDSAKIQAMQQRDRNSLAASCDKTHLFVIWGLTPLPPPLTPPAEATPPSNEADSSHMQSASDPVRHCIAAQGRPVAGQTRLESSMQAQAATRSGVIAQNADHNITDRDSVLRNGDFRGLTGPDDLVASLRRLRPHLHASGPFSTRSVDAATQHATAALLAKSSSDVTGSGGGSESSGGGLARGKAGHGMQVGGSSSAEAEQSLQPGAETSSTSGSDTQHEQPQSSSDAEAQRAQHSTARPPWSCLKGQCTMQQLKALHHCCSTVACYDIFPKLPTVTHSPQSRQGMVEGQEHESAQDQGCLAQALWSHPVVAAAYLSAGDGAVAVACSDGMLLLLDQATGKLIRRVPNSQLDQRFMEHPKSFAGAAGSKSLTGVRTPWLDPSPVLHCTIWWGRSQSSPGPSDHGLTVAMELPLANDSSRMPKELCISQYSCAEADVPLCKCKDGKETSLAALRTTIPPEMATFGDVDHQDSVLQDITDGIGHPLSNLYGIGIQLPLQHAARRYFTCGKRTNWPFVRGGCSFAEFLD